MNTTDIVIRDPFILADGGRYYLYGTRSETAWGHGDGFDVYESSDLEDWTGPKEIFHRPDDFWADKEFWAPECIRKGNGSGADIIVDEQLAEPGLGLYTEFGPAMRAFLLSILNIVEGNKASVVIATTHNYVLDYVDALTGSRDGMSDLLSGITLDLAFLKEIAEKL